MPRFPVLADALKTVDFSPSLLSHIFRPEVATWLCSEVLASERMKPLKLAHCGILYWLRMKLLSVH